MTENTPRKLKITNVTWRMATFEQAPPIGQNLIKNTHEVIQVTPFIKINIALI